MANFIPSKKEASDFNSGVQYINGDMVQAVTINNLVESALYSQQTADTAKATAQDALDRITFQFDINTFKAMYPVGSIYVQYPLTFTPAQMAMGTSWEVATEYIGRAIYGGSQVELGSTAGSDTITLAPKHIPSMAARIDVWNNQYLSGVVEGDLPAEQGVGMAPVNSWKFGSDRAGSFNVGVVNNEAINIIPSNIKVIVWRRIA